MSSETSESAYESLLERLQRELSTLPDKPDETPESTLSCLWALASGESIAVSQVAEFTRKPLSDAEAGRLTSLVEQRLAGTPLAHLTGRQDFMNLIMLASPNALVPRKETEILGNAAVTLLAKTRSRSIVIDVCTGAGNVALGIANQVPAARVAGSDLSPEAIELARRNAAFLQREDVEFLCGDLLEPFRKSEFIGNVDLLTCNPPYISSGRVESMPGEISGHEPRLAFDGGPFGVGIVRRLIKEAPEFLRHGGWLVFEIGLGQGPSVAKGLERNPHFDSVGTHCDREGEIRVIQARRASA